MARLLLLMITLGVVGWLAYTQISSPSAHSRPKQTLDNAQKAADKIEADLQKNADAIEKNANEKKIQE